MKELNFAYSPKPAFGEPIVADLKAYLIDKKFTEDASNPEDQGSYYLSSSVICHLAAPTTSPISLLCSDVADYTAAASTIAPFAQAYEAGYSSTDSSSVVYGFPKINSSITGYQTAQVGVGNYVDARGRGYYYGNTFLHLS